MFDRGGKGVSLHPRWHCCCWPTFRMKTSIRGGDSHCELVRISPVRNIEIYFFRSEGRGRISVVESHVELRCFDPGQRRLPLKAFDFVNWEQNTIIRDRPENRIRESSVLVTEMFFFLSDISCCGILCAMLEDVCLRSQSGLRKQSCWQYKATPRWEVLGKLGWIRVLQFNEECHGTYVSGSVCHFLGRWNVPVCERTPDPFITVSTGWTYRNAYFQSKP